jgi:hypothetical protein
MDNFYTVQKKKIYKSSCSRPTLKTIFINFNSHHFLIISWYNRIKKTNKKTSRGRHRYMTPEVHEKKGDKKNYGRAYNSTQ